MKVKLYTFLHAANGLNIELIPETEQEFELLRGVWRHGKLNTCYANHSKYGCGFAIEWRLPDDVAKKEVSDDKATNAH